LVLPWPNFSFLTLFKTRYFHLAGLLLLVQLYLCTNPSLPFVA
jgi:hypothetical protein